MNDSQLPSSSNYWSQKISAFLHDTPDKVLGIRDHERRADALQKVFGLESSEEFRKQADFAASAADRIPWPIWKKVSSDYDSQSNPFKHPLSGEKVELDDLRHDAELEQFETMPFLHQQEDTPEHQRRSFLALWRLWQNWASDKNPEFGFYPAETRLPDHNIWSHLSITSAMQGCYGGSKADWDAHSKTSKPLPDHPTLLLFSIGPVQDFIAAARTTRDLWSGSYLLSFLVSKALGKIARDFGPDHAIFPNLKGQPLVDLALQEEWENCGSSQDKDFWTAFDYDSPEGKRAALTPSLPNRFLAILPAKMIGHPWKDAADYASHLAVEIQDCLSDIAESISSKLDGEDAFLSDRFTQQVENLLDIHWQLVPITGSVESLRKKAEQLPADEEFAPLAGLDAVIKMVQSMPEDHRDERYFYEGKDGDKKQLNQPASAWPALYTMAGWQLDGAKSLRSFNAANSGVWQKGREHNKDSLTGKEEACLIAPEEQEKCEILSKLIYKKAPEDSIKANEFLGAATLIKRFWHVTYLKKEHGFVAWDFQMPNTPSLADHRPYDNSSEENKGDEDSAKYYAVLALDGDQMGQWVSGSKCPEMKTLLSEEAVKYFEENGNADFLKAKRPLSPSFHLQFSEMLGNFSLHCARRIVEAFDGRLIYAGGDDVLAMLPADTAIDCAAALRAAFRGDEKLVTDLPALFQQAPSGCIRLTEEAARKNNHGKDPLVSDPHRFPVLVPGPATDVSCGIAIGHIKSPLQDLVRAAQTAEKRAKNELNRAACAVSLYKRSGEIIEWGFKWNDQEASTAPVLPLFTTMLNALREGTLTNRFPYKLIQLLDPYLSHLSSDAQPAETPGFAEKAGDIVRLELLNCLKQHLTGSGNVTAENIAQSFDIYWKSLDTPQNQGGRDLAQNSDAKIRDLVGLLSTLAWINKHKIPELKSSRKAALA